MGGVIVDTSALIFLGRLGRLDLLTPLGEVAVPRPVLVEFLRGRAKDPDTVNLVEKWMERGGGRVLNVNPPPGFHPTLGIGERAVLLAAHRVEAPILVIDEGPARRVAKHLGYPVMSTPYVLLRGARDGFLTPAEAIKDLERLVGFGYFLDARLFADLVATLRGLA